MLENKKGFTLIELMIVMAIIGILAVFALMAIAGKSADARDARRTSDANRIQLAFSIHGADHGGDYLEGVPADGITMLLHEFDNTDELPYLDLDYVKDPITGRTDTCYGGTGAILQCDRAGGYTLFDLLQSDANNMGTFDNYAIGVKLEQADSLSYFDRIDWRKLVGVKTVKAATCGNAICETADEEHMAFSPNYCPGDCPCNQDWDCDAGEEMTWCYCDCGGFMGCGPFVCGDLMCNWGEINTCPADCAPAVCGDGICSPAEMMSGTCPADCDGGGDVEDESDWLVITPSGLYRSAIDEVDLMDLIVW